MSWAFASFIPEKRKAKTSNPRDRAKSDKHREYVKLIFFMRLIKILVIIEEEGNRSDSLPNYYFIYLLF
jgi:hypothetical protein